jgi:hypothetical protein
MLHLTDLQDFEISIQKYKIKDVEFDQNLFME